MSRIHHNRKYLAIIMPLVISLASGCIFKRQEDPSEKHTGRSVPESVFTSGQQAYMDRDFATAAAEMGSYANSHESTPKGLEARYWQAMSLLEMGHVRRARVLLEEVRANDTAPRPVQALAMRGMAQSYMAEEDYARAQSTFLRLRSLYAEESSEEEILAALVECANRAGDEAAASGYRRQLQQRFPKSPYNATPAVEAATGSGNHDNAHFTVQAGVFSSRIFAGRLVKKLKTKGIDAIVVTHPEIGAGYAVQAGAFSTRQRAEKHARRIRKFGFGAIVKP